MSMKVLNCAAAGGDERVQCRHEAAPLPSTKSHEDQPRCRDLRATERSQVQGRATHKTTPRATVTLLLPGWGWDADMDAGRRRALVKGESKELPAKRLLRLRWSVWGCSPSADSQSSRHVSAPWGSKRQPCLSSFWADGTQNNWNIEMREDGRCVKGVTVWKEVVFFKDVFGSIQKALRLSHTNLL